MTNHMRDLHILIFFRIFKTKNMAINDIYTYTADLSGISGYKPSILENYTPPSTPITADTTVIANQPDPVDADFEDWSSKPISTATQTAIRETTQGAQSTSTSSSNATGAIKTQASDSENVDNAPIGNDFNAHGVSLTGITFDPTTMGGKSNNPFSIRTGGSNWKGALDKRYETIHGGFVRFDSPYMGIRAGLKVIKNYKTLHNITDIDTFIHRYAPPEDKNDTNEYARFLKEELGLDPSKNHNIDLTNRETLAKFAQAIAKKESRSTIPLDALYAIIDREGLAASKMQQGGKFAILDRFDSDIRNRDAFKKEAIQALMQSSMWDVLSTIDANDAAQLYMEKAKNIPLQTGVDPTAAKVNFLVDLVGSIEGTGNWASEQIRRNNITAALSTEDPQKNVQEVQAQRIADADEFTFSGEQKKNKNGNTSELFI